MKDILIDGWNHAQSTGIIKFAKCHRPHWSRSVISNVFNSRWIKQQSLPTHRIYKNLSSSSHLVKACTNVLEFECPIKFYIFTSQTRLFDLLVWNSSEPWREYTTGYCLEVQKGDTILTACTSPTKINFFFRVQIGNSLVLLGFKPPTPWLCERTVDIWMPQTFICFMGETSWINIFHVSRIRRQHVWHSDVRKLWNAWLPDVGSSNLYYQDRLCSSSRSQTLALSFSHFVLYWCASLFSFMSLCVLYKLVHRWTSSYALCFCKKNYSGAEPMMKSNKPAVFKRVFIFITYFLSSFFGFGTHCLRYLFSEICSQSIFFRWNLGFRVRLG
jgi:hypothetical protein